MLIRIGPLPALVLAVAACAAGRDAIANGASDQAAAGIVNQSGHQFDLAKLKDPIGDIFRSASVPTSFGGLISALASADPHKTCATRVALVSERAQLLNQAQPFRVVFIRSCGTSTVLLSPMQSISAGDPVPSDVEILALDETQNQFDFYSLEHGQLHFMGTSTDMLEGPGSGSGGSQQRRCANCHAGGGPVMKELILPWANWDGPTGIHFNGGTTSPGSNDVFVQLTTALGLPKETTTHATGDILQNFVQDGNKRWNHTRLAMLSAKGTPSLLRPLFCTVEVNLQTAPGLRQPMTIFDPDFFVNATRFNAFDAPPIGMTGEAYTATVQPHQKVVDENGAELSAGGEKLVDTAFAFNHPFASFADNDYIADVAAVTSGSLVDAIVAVDFTTPVFSDRRCGLLTRVPNVPVDLSHPATYAKAITDGLTSNLEAASPSTGSPEAELLQNLREAGGPGARVTSFLKTCGERATKDPKGFMLDALKVESLRRAKFRALPIFEHRELLPDDDLVPTAVTHLDPVDCTLK
jgi:hypothetical protein